MKLFESLINVATSAALLLMPMPAEAAPTSCWLRFPGDPAEVSGQTCDYNVRKEGDIKVIYLTTISDGATARIVLWFSEDRRPLYAEVNLPVSDTERRTFTFDFQIDSAGDAHLIHKSGLELWFTPLRAVDSAPAIPPAFSGGVTA